jgi:hypothetical protein
MPPRPADAAAAARAQLALLEAWLKAHHPESVLIPCKPDTKQVSALGLSERATERASETRRR